MKRAAWAGRNRLLKVVALIIIAGIAGVLVWYILHKNSRSVSTANESVAQSQISLFKNAKTPNDMRELASAYEQNGQYDQAKGEWQKIATLTHQTGDLWALLNICASYKVNDRSGCINSTANILRGRVKNMDFQTAYAIGLLLDSGGNGKLAISFYERALSIYSPPNDDAVSYPSKAQLQEKINELSK